MLGAPRASWLMILFFFFFLIILPKIAIIDNLKTSFEKHLAFFLNIIHELSGNYSKLFREVFGLDPKVLNQRSWVFQFAIWQHCSLQMHKFKIKLSELSKQNEFHLHDRFTSFFSDTQKCHSLVFIFNPFLNESCKTILSLILYSTFWKFLSKPVWPVYNSTTFQIWLSIEFWNFEEFIFGQLIFQYR